MVLSWFDNRKVDAFVDTEVAEILRRAPPGQLDAPGAAGKKAQDQLAKAHDLALRHARDFVQREKPGLFQKARIANRLKWALIEAKYPAGFVNEFALAVASVVAAAHSQREI